MNIAVAAAAMMTVNGCKRDASLAESRVVASTAVQASAATDVTAPKTNANNGNEASISYFVKVRQNRNTPPELGVRVCPHNIQLTLLRAPIDEASALIRDIKVGKRDATMSNGTISLTQASPGECVSYNVAVGQAIETSRFDALESGDDLLLSPDLWLWNPEPRSGKSSAPAKTTVQFDLPAGWSAAVPWPKLADNTYTIPESAFVWRTQGAFGTLPQHAFETGGATISAYVLGDGWGTQHQQVLDWVESSAAAVTALFGRFPTKTAQTLLVTTPAGHSTFGMAMHGGGMSTFVLLPKDLDTSNIDARWTVVHELLHFSLPPVVNKDAWLHEGITTYLTTKARARAGLISESFAWWELLDGFERGSSRGSGRTLREESAAMRQTHQYWRVYWSGAAMALSMDMSLTESGSSLEQTLLDLADSKVDHTHRWKGHEVLKLLDQACGSSVPSDASLPHLDKSTFPDTAAMASELGVRIAGKHRVHINGAAPKALLRAKLMAPTATDSTAATNGAPPPNK